MKKRFSLSVFVWAMMLFCQHAFAQELIDGTYHIKSVEDLKAFATKVNNGENTANALLTCDLDLNNIPHTPIGTNESPYMGHFDGGTHSISNIFIYNTSQPQQGFFGTIGGGCVIENLVIESGRIQGDKACAGLVGACRGNAGSFIKIVNCGNNARVTCRAENAAGILGCNYDGHTTVRIINCYNTGIIQGGKESAAISGWMGSAPGSILENCYNSGKVSGMDNGKNLCRSGDDKTTISNCYDVAIGITKKQGNKSLKQADKKSGKLCYLLGATFTQNLGEDDLPTFGHKAVAHVTGDLYVNEGDTVSVLELKDGETQLSLNKKCVLDSISYTREFTEGGVWEPLFVPFDSKTEDWNGMTIAKLYDIRLSGNADQQNEIEFVVLKEGETVKQNTPYIIMAKEAGTYTIETSKATVFNPNTKPVWCANTEMTFYLKGNYQSTKIAPNTYAILEGESVIPTETETTIKPMRWFLSAEAKSPYITAQVPALKLKVYANDVTGIQSIPSETKATGAWYGLDGKTVDKPQKGIFVKNGKKYLCK